MYEFDGNHIQYLVQITFLYIASIIFMYILLVILYNHIMGREAVGNASGVWKFNFATSFSFSLIEQLVGNNVWNTTKIGSVTLGLIESYLNNETLELFASNSYIFIKHYGDNNTLLFLDLKTGIVRDCFSLWCSWNNAMLS